MDYAGRPELFEGLRIWEEGYRSLQGTYPVISLSFASVKTNTFENARRQICGLLEKLYQERRFLLRGNFLSGSEKGQFLGVDSRMDDSAACYALYHLSDYLSRFSCY